jgi:NADH-quinone oxidoreductase subunit J
MDYTLILATALGAISLYLMLPRGRAALVKLGALIGVLALGAGLLGWFHWTAQEQAVHYPGPPAIFFYIFAAIALASAAGVVCHPRPLYAALYFVLLTLAAAALFLLLRAEFIAVVLIIIYAGAILVTYVFVIMLASPGGEIPAADYDRISADPLAAVLVSFLLLGTILQMMSYGQAALAHGPGAVPAAGPAGFGGMGMLGANLYSHYALPLELAGVLLTVSLVGAVMIARKNEPPVRMLDSGEIPAE